MREIKFRAWDKSEEIMCHNANHLSPNWFWEHPNLVQMQYTGLKDKNGKGRETYHQDILRIGDGYSGDHFEKGGAFIIEWFDDGWGIASKDGEYFYSLFEAIYNRGAEVIGNIWENGELLK